MNARALALSALFLGAGLARATPSGNRWALAACGSGCPTGTRSRFRAGFPASERPASSHRRSAPTHAGGCGARAGALLHFEADVLAKYVAGAVSAQLRALASGAAAASSGAGLSEGSCGLLSRRNSDT